MEFLKLQENKLWFLFSNFLLYIKLGAIDTEMCGVKILKNWPKTLPFTRILSDIASLDLADYFT